VGGQFGKKIVLSQEPLKEASILQLPAGSVFSAALHSSSCMEPVEKLSFVWAPAFTTREVMELLAAQGHTHIISEKNLQANVIRGIHDHCN
jgi:hypothetical protein